MAPTFSMSAVLLVLAVVAAANLHGAVSAPASCATVAGAQTFVSFLENTTSSSGPYQQAAAELLHLLTNSVNSTFFLPATFDETTIFSVAALHFVLEQGAIASAAAALEGGVVLYTAAETATLGAIGNNQFGIPTGNATFPVKMWQLSPTGKVFVSTGGWPSTDTTNVQTITSADNACGTNSVVHVISSQLTAPPVLSKVLAAYADFDQLAKYIPSTFDSEAGVTILVPTNAAVLALTRSFGSGLIAYFTTTAEGAEIFGDILAYHILPSPGYIMYYTTTLNRLIAAEGGSFAAITALAANLSAPVSELNSQKVAISGAVSGNTNTLVAKTGAKLAQPNPIGVGLSSGDYGLNLLTSTGVVHALNGINIPANIALLVDKVITGIGATAFLNMTATSAPGLYSYLTNANSTVTVFAPTNTAFQNAASKLATLTSQQLIDVLGLHVLSSTVVSANLGAAPSGTYSSYNGVDQLVIGTLSGTSQPISVKNGASTSTVSIAFTSLGQNGAVYSVNDVLLPASIAPIPTPTPSATAGTGTPTPSTGDSSVTVASAMLTLFIVIATALMSTMVSV